MTKQNHVLNYHRNQQLNQNRSFFYLQNLFSHRYIQNIYSSVNGVKDLLNNNNVLNEVFGNKENLDGIIENIKKIPDDNIKSIKGFLEYVLAFNPDSDLVSEITNEDVNNEIANYPVDQNVKENKIENFAEVIFWLELLLNVFI